MTAATITTTRIGRRSLHESSGGCFTTRNADTAGGFSLIEVTIAIGIVTFCLIAILGLLPTGLKAVKNANEEAGAANVLNAIASSLRNANSTNGINYSASFAGQPITYTVGGGTVSNAWPNLTLEGTTNATWKRLSAILLITPPSDNMATNGRATISVAWSAAANPQWNPSSNSWSRAEGFLTSGIQFRPRQ